MLLAKHVGDELQFLDGPCQSNSFWYFRLVVAR
jgi:hypothetical protein